jgi:hypothetical protein
LKLTDPPRPEATAELADNDELPAPWDELVLLVGDAELLALAPPAVPELPDEEEELGEFG